MMRLILLLFLLGITPSAADAQYRYRQADTLAIQARQIDSLDAIRMAMIAKRDTVAPQLLRSRDSLQLIEYINTTKEPFGFAVFNLEESIKNFRRAGPLPVYQEGVVVARGELWVLVTLGVLLVIFAFLKLVFDKPLTAIVQSFFSNRILGNINKEDNLFTAWPFFLLFVQFGFVIGLFLYLAAQHQQLAFAKDGFEVFLSLSVAVVLLYGFKIVALRILGFFFNIQKPVSDYVSILYLSYFNAALVFMPLVIAFALSPARFGEFYMVMAAILLVIIFGFQFARAGVTVLSQNRFSKVYLFLYFCTLEICPILILVKAIGFKW